MNAETAVIPGANETLLDGPVAAGEGAAMELIGRWLDLSELERRAFVALARELTVSADLVESSTLELSERFQKLATIAQAQMGQVETIISVAKCVEMNGEMVPIDLAMHSVEDVLRKVIETILSVSKHAMRMVYALEAVSRDVAGAERCVAQIEKINTKTRYLALNASIEASRSGEAGAAFRVIAREIKDLSRATEETSQQVRERISSVTRGVRNGHTVLKEIATLDMSEHILAKQQLDSLIAGIISQNRSFTAVLADAASSSEAMALTVGQMITGMQFQDRTKQHIGQVVDALGVLGDGALSVQQATMETFPGAFQTGLINVVWLDRLLERQTLGAVKRRLMARLLSDGEASSEEGAAPDEAPSNGDVELF